MRVVTHRHHPVVRTDEVDDLRLQGVGVLVFVHQRVAEALLEVARHVGRGPEHLEPVLEEIVVIDDALLPFAFAIGHGESNDEIGELLVLGIETRDCLAERALGVARKTDDLEQRAGPRMRLFLEEAPVLFVGHLTEEALRFVGVEDGEGAGETHDLAVDAQDLVPDVVKGAAPEPVGFDAGQVLHPVEHLPGGLVGEGEEEDLVRPDALAEQMGDAVGEGARLAGTGASQHEQRPRRGGDRGVLFIVEIPAEIDRRDL